LKFVSVRLSFCCLIFYLFIFFGLSIDRCSLWICSQKKKKKKLKGKREAAKPANKQESKQNKSYEYEDTDTDTFTDAKRYK